METLRTPDERFANLPGYAFAPHYLELPAGDGSLLRMHYVDEGPPAGRVLLLLHGEPTWSYLYRKMIPHFTAAGYRSVAPDLIGFGRSDKPVERAAYSYANHVGWLAALLAQLDLHGVVMVGQDWGGLLGLRLVAEHPERFAGFVAANTFLPTGDEPANEAFERWRAASQRMSPFSAGYILSRTCTPPVAAEVAAAYDAPFPDESFKAGARQFPLLVPTTPDDPAAPANRRAWEALAGWQKPFLCAFSDSDPVTKGADRPMRETIPGAKAEHHVTIAGAGHFLQEDKGEELADVVAGFVLG